MGHESCQRSKWRLGRVHGRCPAPVTADALQTHSARVGAAERPAAVPPLLPFLLVVVCGALAAIALAHLLNPAVLHSDPVQEELVQVHQEEKALHRAEGRVKQLAKGQQDALVQL